MTMFKKKKVFRLKKIKVRNDLNKISTTQAIGRNIVISVISIQKPNPCLNRISSIPSTCIATDSV